MSAMIQIIKVKMAYENKVKAIPLSNNHTRKPKLLSSANAGYQKLICS